MTRARRGLGALSVAVALVLATCCGTAAGYLAGGKPLITSTYVSGLSKHAATLTAVIDPEGGETSYELWLEYSRCEGCEATREAVGTGTIAFSRSGLSGGGYESDAVSTTVKTLAANLMYRFWVVASNPSGFAEASARTFEASKAGEERLAQERRLQEEEEVPPTIRPFLLEEALRTAAANGDAHPKAVEAVKAIVQTGELPKESTVAYIALASGHFVCSTCIVKPKERPLKGKSFSLFFNAETLSPIRFVFDPKSSTLSGRGLAVVLEGSS